MTPTETPRAYPALAVAAVVVAVAAVFAPAVGCGFVNYDDHGYVFENPRVLAGPTPDGFVWAVTTLDATNWHPLTWLSLQLDALVSKGDPAGYHLTNVAFHAANAGLLCVALRRLTGSTRRSAVAALLWGLHPLRVESVAWVSERKDVLCAFFGLLTVLAYVRYAAAPSVRRFLPVVGLFALGLLAKPMLVTLPCVLLLLDVWPLGRLQPTERSVRRRLREKAVLFVLAFLSCGITFYAQTYGGAVRALHELSVADRLGNVAVGYVVYLRQFVWPVDLAVVYPLPTEARPPADVAGAVALLVAATAAAVALRRRAPYVPVGWFWFLGTLVPVIGVVHVGETAHADRYTYLPHVGLFLAAVWGLADLAARVRVPRPAGWAGAAVAAGVLAALTRTQIGYWQNGGTLWEHCIAATGPNPYAWVCLGKHRLSVGDPDGALQCWDAALAISPDDFEANAARAFVLEKRGLWGNRP